MILSNIKPRVSVQGVKSLGGHFVCLCRSLNFMKKKICIFFSKRKWKYFYTFNHFHSEIPGIYFSTDTSLKIFDKYGTEQNKKETKRK